jgi:C-terminal processing protease CtpA/Prc
VESEAAWQLRQVAGRGERTRDLVKPGTTRYRGGLVVLVDRWTAGEAEALATGLDGAASAVLVGTPMAGLHGERAGAHAAAQQGRRALPAQRTFHVNGTPRELVRPDVEVDLASPSGGRATRSSTRASRQLLLHPLVEALHVDHDALVRAPRRSARARPRRAP